MIVRFEFHGGCKDGVVVVGQDDVELGEAKNPAHIYLFLSDGGRVGARFRQALPSHVRQAWLKEHLDVVRKAVRAGTPVPKMEYPPEHEIYQVTDRRKGPDEISIRVDYVGEEAAGRVGGGPEPPRSACLVETADGFRESILKDSFKAIGFDDGVGLVGILFEYRIVFSRRFRDLLGEHKARIDLEPLEPQAACLLVGRIFGMNSDVLFLAFRQNWARLKHSPKVKRLIAAIEAHAYVDRLEPCQSL